MSAILGAEVLVPILRSIAADSDQPSRICARRVSSRTPSCTPAARLATQHSSFTAHSSHSLTSHPHHHTYAASPRQLRSRVESHAPLVTTRQLSAGVTSLSVENAAHCDSCLSCILWALYGLSDVLVRLLSAVYDVHAAPHAATMRPCECDATRRGRRVWRV